MNYFVAGKHPLYNGKNGTSLIQFDTGKQPRNFILEDSNLFKFYRHDREFDGASAYRGITTNE